MNLKKRNGIKITPILKLISKNRTIDRNGSASWQGNTTKFEIESFLKTALFFEDRTMAFLERVIQEAIVAEQNLEERKFFAHANKIANQLDQKKRKMKVVFPIWAGDTILSGNRKWKDVRISFNVNPKSQFVRKAKEERVIQFEKRARDIGLEGWDFSDLPLAVCTVEAIDSFDAFELAVKAISIELGLWSLSWYRGQYIVSSGAIDEPINRILLAPYMTAHEISGSMTNDVFWLNRWPNKLRQENPSQESIKIIRSTANSYRDGIHNLPKKWRKLAEQVLARQYDAFSQVDLEASFLDGWRLLEAIGGNPREKSETLVKRAAWFFEDVEVKTQMGLHLMHRRNEISHGRPIEASDNEGLAFQMKEFVAPFLHAVLTNPFKFKTIEELWEFCDLPLDQEVRKRKLDHLERAARFRKEK
ncbi:MAG: hypothetical protein ABJK39_10355 [Hyphomicrobiales bacterium]